jgi:hypothetical protein
MTRLALTAAALLAAATISTAADKETRVFELRTYAVAADKMADFDAAMKETFSKSFAEGGAKPLGYFKSLDPKECKFVALLSYPDEATQKKAHVYLNGAAQGIAEETAGKLKGVGTDVKTTALTLTDYSPAVEVTKADPARVFELRIYTTTPGNLPALDSRFRDHTIELFKTHGITNLWYFHHAKGTPGADSTLVYFLAHASAKARDKSFDDFRKDPKWVTALKASETKAGGPLTAKDGVKSLMLTPTDYSPIR